MKVQRCQVVQQADAGYGEARLNSADEGLSHVPIIAQFSASHNNSVLYHKNLEIPAVWC
jgi:hypothetical protein